MPEEAAGSASSLASGSGAGGVGGTGAAARDTRAEIELVRAAAVGARGAHERPHSNGDTNVGAASSQRGRRISCVVELGRAARAQRSAREFCVDSYFENGGGRPSFLSVKSSQVKSSLVYTRTTDDREVCVCV